MEVHTFEETTQASEAVTRREGPKDGDILVCTVDGVIGFVYVVWPIFVVADRIHTHAGTHIERGVFIYPPLRWGEFLKRNPMYEASVKRCLEVAWEDGDITGNDHWKEAKDPRG